MKSERILLMRHGEKPDDPLDPALSPAGHKRAKKLAKYIPDKFGKPDFLFATAISKYSKRPYETLKPLSKATGASIDTNFADQD
jgi:broad specificity phosphatase PhoE